MGQYWSTPKRLPSGNFYVQLPFPRRLADILKARARETGKTVGEIVEELAREYLAHRPEYIAELNKSFMAYFEYRMSFEREERYEIAIRE